MTQKRLKKVWEINSGSGKCQKGCRSVDRFLCHAGQPKKKKGRKNGARFRFSREGKTQLPLSSSVSFHSMPLDFELTRLDSSPPPPELRAGASVSVDTSTGQVSLGGVAFATLSAEDVAKVSLSFSNPSPATVRTIRREKDSISSLTIRLVEFSSTQARPQYHHRQQQPRRGEGARLALFFFFTRSLARSIDGILANLNFLLLRLSEPQNPSLHPNFPSPALGPPPSSTLDPDELACRLTKGQLDALASSPQVLEALKSEDTRAAATRALAAADSSSSSSAAAALESEGAPLAGLATAVLDCLERHDEEERK